MDKNYWARPLSPSKASLIKNPSITMRLSSLTEDYEEVVTFPIVDGTEISRRLVEGYVLYFPAEAWQNVLDHHKEDARFVHAFEPSTRKDHVEYGLLGIMYGIGMVTDAFSAPHRKLAAGLYPNKIYWTRLLPAKY